MDELTSALVCRWPYNFQSHTTSGSSASYAQHSAEVQRVVDIVHQRVLLGLRTTTNPGKKGITTTHCWNTIASEQVIVLNMVVFVGY